MLADFLKQYHAQSKSSHLSHAISSSGAATLSPDESASAFHWAPLLAEHRVTKLKQEAAAMLKENGLPFDEQALKEILWQVFHSTSCKLKRDTWRPLSVIHDEKGTSYALFRGILGKGAFGKVKLALNLSTKQMCAVKISGINKELNEDAYQYAKEGIDKEAAFLQKRNLLRGRQERDSKLAKKHYLFIDLLPGITITDFSFLLRRSQETLTDAQQTRLLYGLLKALVKLMEANIFHRDLHEGNILIDPLNWQVNIVDFGLALDISTFPNRDEYYAGNLRGVLSYDFVRDHIRAPHLVALMAELSMTQQGVLPAVKKAMKALKAGFDKKEPVLFDEIFSTLFKHAKAKDFEIIRHLIEYFPERTLTLDDDLLRNVFFNDDTKLITFFKELYWSGKLALSDKIQLPDLLSLALNSEKNSIYHHFQKHSIKNPTLLFEHKNGIFPDNTKNMLKRLIEKEASPKRVVEEENYPLTKVPKIKRR